MIGLQNYLQTLKTLKTGRHFSYSHSFWVRGHFRTYTSDRYIGAKGKKQWVMPYVKGKGLLIEKTRVVER